MLAWRLLLATGEARFADVIERTAFNGILSGLGADGSHFFYSNPLLRRSAGLEVLEGAASTRRAEWFPVSCCPPNLMRFLATFPCQVATVDDRGIQLFQFATGTLEARVGSDVVRLEVTTGYPWTEDVEVTVAQGIGQPWALSIRVPGWCPSATVTLNGSTVLAESGPGLITLDRPWRAADRINLTLRMEPRITSPDPRIDSLRQTVALERGPLVYAVEDADLPADASVESIEVDPALEVQAVSEPIPGLEGAIRLVFDAQVRDDGLDNDWPYASRPVAGPATHLAPPTAGVTVHAVPYFAWAERPRLGMRVWLPIRPGTASEE